MRKTHVPEPGIRSVIKKCTEAGIYSAILTNSPRTLNIRDEIKRWGLLELSQHIFNGPVMGVKKPNPLAIKQVIEAYRAQDDTIAPGNTLLIGDSFDDTSAAVRSKIDCVLIIRPSISKEIQIKEPHPSYIIDNPFYLVEIVAGKKQTLQKKDHKVFVNAPFFNNKGIL